MGIPLPPQCYKAIREAERELPWNDKVDWDEAFYRATGKRVADLLDEPLYIIPSRRGMTRFTFVPEHTV